MHLKKIDNVLNKMVYILLIMLLAPMIIIIFFAALCVFISIFNFDGKALFNSPSLAPIYIALIVWFFVLSILNVIYLIFFTFWRYRGIFFLVKKHGTKVKLQAVSIKSVSRDTEDENGMPYSYTDYFIVYEYKNKKNGINHYYQYTGTRSKPSDKIGRIVDGYIYKGLMMIDG